MLGRLFDAKIFVISVLAGVIVTAAGASYAERTEKGITDNVIRLHILANSDREIDQTLKLRVRDEILARYGEILNGKDISSARSLILENLPKIQETAQNAVYSGGAAYSVSAKLEKSAFPTKTYGDIALPAGTYEALRIEIGAAKGRNWWCVMFPPLCFVDAAQVSDEMKDKLRENLPAESYNVVTNPVKVKFKIVEIFHK
ncbi:stage II sporulation protein R [Clostridia bacterium]|nr:stage II sporulation protein R [Clostridia bacterium]